MLDPISSVGKEEEILRSDWHPMSEDFAVNGKQNLEHK